MILGSEKPSTSESVKECANLSIGNGGMVSHGGKSYTVSPLELLLFSAFLSQTSETMETESLLLDPETCYDSGFSSCDMGQLKCCKNVGQAG